MNITDFLDIIMYFVVFIGVGLIVFGVWPMIYGRLNALRATCIGLGTFGFISMARYWYVESYYRSLPEAIVIETICWFFTSSLLIFLGYWMGKYSYPYLFSKRTVYLNPGNETKLYFPNVFIAVSILIALIYISLERIPLFSIVGHLVKAFILIFFYLWIVTEKRKYLYVALILFSFGVFDTSRRAYVSLFIPCFLLYFEYVRMKNKKISLRLKILSIAALVVLFFYLNWLRSEHDFGEGYQESDRIANTMDYIVTLRSIDVFYNTGFLINNIPDRYGYFYGKTYLSIAVGLIPRSVWPEKPVSLGSILGLMIRYNVGDFDEAMWEKSQQYSLSPGFIGEAYANFGYYGIVFASLILGFIAAIFDKKILKSSLLSPHIFPWSVWLGSFILLHRGSLYAICSNNISDFYFYFFSYFVSFIIKKKI